ncbi:hypothetical protein BDN71DRAFT_234912 [Pleurotus eryngii]|uniref:Uncharacterized protein n=1 Tax=Pleurotus eryngii TaxID=5323 RepID=A0A9P5ZN42_PLEER|nr:hypothetical protein BDN71DRAFT_234912 [Pleurotus eryngii]
MMGHGRIVAPIETSISIHQASPYSTRLISVLGLWLYWALFLVQNRAMVPRGHGRFFHGCRLLRTRALLGLLDIRVYFVIRTTFARAHDWKLGRGRDTQLALAVSARRRLQLWTAPINDDAV